MPSATLHEFSYIHFMVSSFLPLRLFDGGESPHLRPRSPLNLFTLGAAPAGVGLTAFDERSVAAPRPVARPSNLSHGATSAFRGCGPEFSPPMARRADGGSGQSMVDAALEATLGAMLGA
jgi:hypothetical protein